MTEGMAASYNGIGYFALLGIEMTRSDNGLVEGRLEIGPQHRNRAGFVHGGVLCSLIDFGACGAGLHGPAGQDRRLGVTLSLTTQFTKAVQNGMLRVEGKVISAGRRIYSAQAHVFDDAGDLVAHGIGTFQWRREVLPAAPSSPDPTIRE